MNEVVLSVLGDGVSLQPEQCVWRCVCAIFLMVCFRSVINSIICLLLLNLYKGSLGYCSTCSMSELLLITSAPPVNCGTRSVSCRALNEYWQKLES